jgi:hypothetical protein
MLYGRKFILSLPACRSRPLAENSSEIRSTPDHPVIGLHTFCRRAPCKHLPVHTRLDLRERLVCADYGFNHVAIGPTA